jgi:two-component system NtrC family sensor kinase
VLNAVAESAALLCEGPDVTIFLREPNALRVAARHGAIPSGAIPSDTALPLSRETGVAAAVLEGQTVHVADMQTESGQFPVSFRNAHRFGFRTALNVPLMREGVAIGAISLRRTEAHLFTDQQVSLLEAFADQAVIAIENVRLFTELEERNRDLTATSELLRVISRSPTDAQPVFDTIVDSAARLTGAQIAAVLRFDGELYHYLAGFSPVAGADEEYKRAFPRPLEPDVPSARAIRGRCVIRIPDIELDNTIPDGTRQRLRRAGVRSNVQVPMLRDDGAIGVIAVSRTQPIPFTDRQVALLQTFADQAVIAIENVRLFTELRVSNRDLSTALDKQTATSDILRVISQSQTDVQPVFDAIVQSAVRLCGAMYGTVSRFDGTLIQSVAHYNLTPDQIEQSRRTFPRPLSDPGGTATAIRTASVVRVADLDAEDELAGAAARDMLRARGVRSVLVVPMLWQSKQSARSTSPTGKLGPLPTRTSSCLRPSPIRPLSPLRMSGCSRNSKGQPVRYQPPASTSPSSSPTCRTSCGRP